MRYYFDKGVLSKGASLNVMDTDGKFILLIPTSTLPATKGAPATVEKTVLTENIVTQVEGLQTMDQKEYTFNYHRDNIARLEQYRGKQLTFLERNADNTGEKFKGTFTYGRSDVSVNGIEQGTIYLTVSDADESPISDVRDLMKNTAIITTPLNDITLVGTEVYTVKLETTPSATITAAIDSSTVATATVADGTLTITGKTAGNAMVTLTTTATGEATSTRTIAVTVEAAS